MRLGHGQRRSVLILWAWTALLSGFVLYPVYTGQGDAVVPARRGGPRARSCTPCFHPGVRRPAGRATRTEALTADSRSPDDCPASVAASREIVICTARNLSS